ncbi:MAG: hypothetical protein H7339_00525 [Arcicella sp.]|nr:hypothetical protein [Arcicella sp.]
MKAVLNINTNVQLNFSQIAHLAKQLPRKQKSKLASILEKDIQEEEFITKSELVARIKEGLEEVKLYKQGKVEFQSARELLNEL